MQAAPWVLNRWQSAGTSPTGRSHMVNPADAHARGRPVDIAMVSLVKAGAAAGIRKAPPTCGRKPEARDREDGRATERYPYLDVLWTGFYDVHASYSERHPPPRGNNHHCRRRSFRFYGLETD